MGKLSVAMVAGVLLGLSQAGDARACSCVPFPPPRVALEEAYAVFAGTVTGVTRGADPLVPSTATFVVSRVWKGDVGESVEVKTPSNEAACGLEFEEGQEWLVYADLVDDGLYSTLCTRSDLYARATEDRAALGEGTAPGGEKPPPVPGGGGGCVVGHAAPGGEEAWGAFAAVAAAGLWGMRRRGGRRGARR